MRVSFGLKKDVYPFVIKLVIYNLKHMSRKVEQLIFYRKLLLSVTSKAALYVHLFGHDVLFGTYCNFFLRFFYVLVQVYILFVKTRHFICFHNIT